MVGVAFPLLVGKEVDNFSRAARLPDRPADPRWREVLGDARCLGRIVEIAGQQPRRSDCPGTCR